MPLRRTGRSKRKRVRRRKRTGRRKARQTGRRKARRTERRRPRRLLSAREMATTTLAMTTLAMTTNGSQTAATTRRTKKRRRQLRPARQMPRSARTISPPWEEVAAPLPPPPAPSQAVPAASVAPAATATVADALAPDASTSSWSLMARSNPAPFKIPAKADPAPLPAAAAPASPPPDDSAGRFSASGGAVSAAAAATNPASRQRPDGAKPGTSRILSTAAAFGVSGGGAEEDDGEGWVNPSNIKSQKAAGIGLNGPSQSQTKGRGGAAAASMVASQCRAGCVTTDFAMQNVILQVGLPLLSLDGMAVRRVKQWILRCAACFKTTTEMGRHFCPVCGNATLDRVSCSVNAKTGATYLHLRKNHKVNLRGSKFSIPAPNPAKGRFEGDLLLREDQLLTGIWAQKVRRCCGRTIASLSLLALSMPWLVCVHCIIDLGVNFNAR